MNNTNNNEAILKDFSKKIIVFENCEKSLQSLVNLILKTSGISVHSITSRTKSLERFQEKLERKNKYKSINEITDIIGIRIITYFEDEIDIIAKIISNDFEIDKVNSIDKRKIDNDRFGYKSLHYVAQFSKERIKLLEYAPFENIKFEIQIRSILQHSWAEIEHDIGYKGEFEIPDIAKRSFSRIAALLETADIEFVRLKDMLKDYEGVTLENIEKESVNIKIDAATLKNYVTSSSLIESEKKKIADSYNFTNEIKFHSSIEYGIWIEKLQLLDINSIDQLNKLLEEHKNESLEFFKSTYDGHKISELNNAAPIIRLIKYLEWKKYND